MAALRLSVFTTVATVLITLLLGTPVAYLLARYRFPGGELLDTLLDLPMVLPPAVAGVALLMTLGRRGASGRPSRRWGSSQLHDGGGGAGGVVHRRAVLREGGAQRLRDGEPALEEAAAVFGAPRGRRFGA